MTRPATIAELAKATEAVLEEKGWCQNVMIDRDGKVCLGSAINIVAYGSVRPVWDEWDVQNEGFEGVRSDLVTPAILHISKALDAVDILGVDVSEGIPRLMQLWEWNDGIASSVDDVRDALRSIQGDETEIDLYATPVRDA